MNAERRAMGTDALGRLPMKQLPWHVLRAGLLAASLTLLCELVLATTPPHVPSSSAGSTYFTNHCASCHNDTITPGFNQNVTGDFAYFKVAYAKGLRDFVSAHLAAAGQTSTGPMHDLAALPLNDDNLNDLAAYFRTFAPTAAITVTQDYNYQAAIPGYPQTVNTSPAITVQAACTVGSDAVDTVSTSIAAGAASGSINGLMQGENCTLSQTAGPTGGSLTWGYSFGTAGDATFTPASLTSIAASNAVTVKNLVNSPAGATLHLTAAFANNTPAHASATTPIAFNVHCTQRNADLQNSFAANASFDVTNLAQGDSCTVTGSIGSGATPPSGGYTFGAFSYSAAQPISLNAASIPLTLTNTLVTPSASVQISLAYSNNATNHVTTAPSVGIQLVCSLSGTFNPTLVAGAGATVSGLLAGETCTPSETSISGEVLSANYTLSHTPTFSPSGGFTLVPGSGNALTVTHAVIAPGAAQFSMPGPLVFAAQVGGSDTKSTAIANNAASGAAFLTLSGLTLSDPSQYSFGAGNTCTTTTVLAPVSSCTLVITFTPTAPAPLPNTPQQRYATLTVTHDAAGSPSTLALQGTANPAPSPSIQISDATPAIADTYLGSTLTLPPITVSNGPSATAALLISGLTFSDVAAADYTLATGAGACAVGSSLARGDSCTLTVQFAPSQLGTRSAKLTIANNTPASLPNATPVITLAGKGIPVPVPVLSIVSPTPIHFGNRTVGGSYQPQLLTLANTGTADLLISAVQVAGAAFSTADSCAPALAPGAQCQLRIQYRPTTAGQAYTGGVTISSNAAGSPLVVALDGSGVTYTAPVFVWSAASLDFGNVSAGTPSAPQTLTIQNMGPGDATLTLVNVAGVDAVNFVLNLQGCQLNQTVVQGASCTVSVQFVPTASGSRKATLQWSSSGSAPTPVLLQGTGLAGVAAQLAVSSSALDFGSVRVGAASLPQELVLQSQGSSLLHVTAITVSTPYQLLSKDCAEPPFDMAPGLQCKLVLGYTPAAAGAASGAVHIASNSAQTVPDVTLSGQGQPAAEVSGGGCSLASGRTAFDPTLLLLALAAAGVLLRRRRRGSGAVAADDREGRS